MDVDKTASRRSGLDRTGWAALLSLGFGVSLVVMDATIVNVALPVVMRDLRLDASDAQWLGAAYALVFATILATVGRLADRHGRRRMLLVGLVVFLAASTLAGAAAGAASLIAARLGQGLGAAMIVRSALSTLNATFTGRARAVAFAVWGSAIGGMAAVGPFLGGWLATDVSWRWAFWLNLPVGLLVLLGIVRFVPETRDQSATAGTDLLGVLLSTAGMGGIVFGLIEGSWFGWWRQASGALSPVPLALGLGVLALAAFVAVELRRRRASLPVLLDLGLFALPTFRSGVIAALIVAFGEFGLLFTLPLLLQGTLGYSALGTGTLILVLALGTFLVSGLLPRLGSRVSPRTLVRLGLGAEAVAVGGLALTLSSTTGRTVLAGWLLLYGVGVGLATAQLTSLVLADVPRGQSGQASALQSSIRQVGSALGVAVLGGLLVGTLTSSTRAGLTALHLPGATIEQITYAVRSSAGTAIAALQQGADPSVAQAAGAAMIHASRVTTGFAAIALLLGLGATLALPRPTAAATAELSERPTGTSDSATRPVSHAA